MGRLRVLSGREVCSILAGHAVVEVRRRGSNLGLGGAAVVTMYRKAQLG